MFDATQLSSQAWVPRSQYEDYYFQAWRSDRAAISHTYAVNGPEGTAMWIRHGPGLGGDPQEGSSACIPCQMHPAQDHTECYQLYPVKG